jgi:hypothetical protein
LNLAELGQTELCQAKRNIQIYEVYWALILAEPEEKKG